MIFKKRKKKGEGKKEKQRVTSHPSDAHTLRRAAKGKMTALVDEAHLQSLASSLGKKQESHEQAGQKLYVRDPQCHGEESLFKTTTKTPFSKKKTDLLCLDLAETLQDLLRFLRRDTTRERPVMMQLHAWNLVEKDLLPLILTYHSETDHSIVDASEY